MVLISHRKKFIYIKNKKVAGTTIEIFFEKYCTDPNKEYVANHSTPTIISNYGIIGSRLKKDSKYNNHINAEKIVKYIGKDIFNSYFKFCVVRNPFDKMVSLYFYKKANEKMSFKEFCKKRNCRNIERYKINNKLVCDFYIRYENLNEDIEKVCKILNIEYDEKLIGSYKSEFREERNYRKFYDEETKEIVYEKHKEEFEFFGYKF